jgi:predicted DNA-binding mobile mystery protein A
MLSAKMAKLGEIENLAPPAGGWLKAIRVAIGMPSTYAARRLGITARSFREFEENEAAGTITLKTLRRAADAIDCELVYALVPRVGSLEAIIEKQAHKQAEKLVRPVAHSMRLEGQSTEAASDRIDELSKQFAATPNASLWDEG